MDLMTWPFESDRCSSRWGPGTEHSSHKCLVLEPEYSTQLNLTPQHWPLPWSCSFHTFSFPRDPF